MKILNLIAGTMAVLLLGLCSAAAADPQPDLASAWFKPTLTVNESPICSPLVDTVRKNFYGTGLWGRFDDFTPLIPVDKDTLEQIPAQNPDSKPDEPVPFTGINDVVLTIAGTKLYVREDVYFTNAGAFFSSRLIGNDRPLPVQVPRDSDATLFAPPSAPLVHTSISLGWQIYDDEQGDFYTAGLTFKDDYFQPSHLDAFEVYRIGLPEKLKLVCRGILAPDSRSPAATQSRRIVTASVEALAATVTAMTRPGAYCGTSNFGNAAAAEGYEALHQVLYRPWAIQPWDLTYEQTLPYLREWATIGISEHDAFVAYLSQFSRTRRLLASFYVGQNHWSRTQADAMADSALELAVAANLHFNPNYPPTFESLDRVKQAILDHRPMTEVMMLASSLNIREMEQGDGESILNAAVKYPEAIRFLLDSGANPNRANSFGKTPLMYAAQYNQVESTSLLLAAGANPNAQTIFPPQSDCYHRLEIAQMTPLHYGARYASARLIRLLLNKGASIKNATTGNLPGLDGQYPVDWLMKYTAANATERNSNLSPADVRTLEPLLHVTKEQN